MVSVSIAPRIGIIAGAGRLPALLIAAALEQGRDPFVVALKGHADAPEIETVDHAWVRLGAPGKALKILKENDIADVVLAGKVVRPGLAELRPDALAVRVFAKLGTAAMQDDALMRAIASVLEGEGLSVSAPDRLMEGLLAEEGCYGRITPDARAQADIAIGIDAVHGLGALDIGQACVVQQGRVLGLEAAEGTSGLIERCAGLADPEAGGPVLVKAAKPKQDRRIDLPAIGVDTVHMAHRSGFAGIAIEAGGALIIDRLSVVDAADAGGLFVIAVATDAQS